MELINKGFWLLKFNFTSNSGIDSFTAEKIKGAKDVYVSDLTSEEVGVSSSIQSLENNKYLVGTQNKGFWLLEFNDDTDKFSIAKRIEGAKGVDILVLTSGNVGYGSSMQKLGKNKYLVGTNNEGFWLLKFDDGGLVVQANKIQDENGDDVPVLADDGFVGWGSSIQDLGNNKYLVGTKTKGFWLLVFDDNGLVVQANKIKGSKSSNLTIDGGVGYGSSIQKLGENNNKYLIGTNKEGFWFLEFNNTNNQFKVSKIKDSNNNEILDLTDSDYIGEGSSIQSLGDNKYLVGTNKRGFWFLKFDNDKNQFKANEIKGPDVSDLTSSEVGRNSSIQDLKNNKYLVGTYDKGFYLLEFDNENQFDYFSFEKGDLIFKSLFGSVEQINKFISTKADTVFKIKEWINKLTKLTINKNKINNLSDDDKLNLINLINLFEFFNNYNTDSTITQNDKILNFDFIKEILKDNSLNNEQKDIALGLKKDEDYAIYKDKDSKTTPIFTSNDLISENQITLQKLTQKLKNIEDNNKKKKVIETFTNWLSVTLLDLKKSELSNINEQIKLTSLSTISSKLKIIIPIVVICLILLLISTFFIIKYKKSKLKNKN